MLIEKSELDKRIEKILPVTIRYKHIITDMYNYFNTKNIPIIYVTKIVDKKLPLASFSGNSYIYMAFVIALHDVLSKNDTYKKLAAQITPDKFFTDIELKRYDEKVFDKEEKDFSVIVFEGFSRVDDDQYIGVLPLKNLVEMFDNGRLEYNEKTQRPFKSKIIKNGENYDIVSRIDINLNSVNEITERILDGTYIYDTITINVVSVENSKVDVQGNVIKTENCEFHVNDGFHRCIASSKAFIKNPNIEKNWEIRLVFFDEQKANRLIVQFDKRNPLDKEAIASKDESNLATGIVKDLNTISKLKGRIGISKTLTPFQIIKFSEMAQSIDSIFQLKTTFDLIQNKQYIIDGFNFFVDSGIIPLDEPLGQPKLLLCCMLLKKYKGSDYMLKITDEFEKNKKLFNEIYQVKGTAKMTNTINEIKRILGW